MDIGSAYPSKYLKASDLQGREVTVHIASVSVEDVGGQGDSADAKPVVYFQGKDKGFVLNKTNANTIAGLYGTETDGWEGKPITLFPTQTEFGGKAVPCIRVKIHAPRAPQRQPQPVAAGHEPLADEDMDIPF